MQGTGWRWLWTVGSQGKLCGCTYALGLGPGAAASLEVGEERAGPHPEPDAWQTGVAPILISRKGHFFGDRGPTVDSHTVHLSYIFAL